jgi:hypothetical protein
MNFVDGTLTGLLSFFPVFLVAMLVFFDSESKGWKTAPRARIWVSLVAFQIAIVESIILVLALMHAFETAGTKQEVLSVLYLVGGGGVALFLVVSLTGITHRAMVALDRFLTPQKRAARRAGLHLFLEIVGSTVVTGALIFLIMCLTGDASA